MIYSKNQDKPRKAYSIKRVRVMSGGDSEALNVGILAVNGSEVLERKVDFWGGYRIASVLYHLKHSPSSQVVSVTLRAFFVDVAGQTRS